MLPNDPSLGYTDGVAEPNMIQMNVKVPAFLLGQVHSAAKAADLLVSQWVRQALREKLERDRAVERAALRDPAIRSAIAETKSGDRSLLRRREP